MEKGTPTVSPEAQKAEPIIITVAVPTHDMCQSLWAYDYANMLTYTIAMLGDRIGLRLVMVTNTYIQQARNQLAEVAVDEGSHYLLFIDSDMRFPKDALIRLLAHDVDVVGANYATRGFPPQFVAINTRTVPEAHKGDMRSNRLPTFDDSTGLERAHAIGGGLTLIKAKVFEHLPKPWYNTVSVDDGTVIGEDVWFCRLLEDAGIDVWVDHDLSKAVGHVGGFTFETTHAAEIWRTAEEAQNESGHVQQSEDGDRDASQPNGPVLVR
jgi:hypothetical protein